MHATLPWAWDPPTLEPHSAHPALPSLSRRARTKENMSYTPSPPGLGADPWYRDVPAIVSLLTHGILKPLKDVGRSCYLL